MPDLDLCGFVEAIRLQMHFGVPVVRSFVKQVALLEMMVIVW